MNCRWSLSALAAAALCVSSASAQRFGNVELGVLGRYLIVDSEHDMNNALGAGGSLALFLSNRFKLTADGTWHPSHFKDNGADVTIAPLHFGLAYEHPLNESTRAVLGGHFAYLATPTSVLNDVGVGGSLGLKFGLTRKLSFVTQAVGDVMPAWFNPRTYILRAPVTQRVVFVHKPDAHFGVGAGLALRLGGDGTLTARPVVIAEVPPPPTEVKSSGTSQPPPAQTQPQPQPQPQPAPPPAQPERTVELEPIYFDFDRWTLGDDAVATLDRITEILRANPGSYILIEGHTDERGTEAYNIRLGDRRAEAANGYLTKQGVEASRLRIVSRGSKQPADPGHSETAYAHNRRVEFRIQSGGPLRAPKN